eukprot:snap_masked-scaffold_15-processed-gene-9.19-mRNA-1 protein AED:1.00 eAED:1.00 QI:0/-1/0/0/-1/1/1/0/101
MTFLSRVPYFKEKQYEEQNLKNTECDFFFVVLTYIIYTGFVRVEFLSAEQKAEEEFTHSSSNTGCWPRLWLCLKCEVEALRCIDLSSSCTLMKIEICNSYK